MRFAVLSLFLVLGFVLSPVPTVWADNIEDCEKETNLERKIDSCKEIFERAGKALAESGDGYFRRYEYVQAIEQYKKVIGIIDLERGRINVGLRSAYFNRGVYHWNNKRYWAAVHDWWHWATIEPWKLLAGLLAIILLFYSVFYGVSRALSWLLRRVLRVLSQIGCYLCAKQQAVAMIVWRIRWWGGAGPSAVAHFEQVGGLCPPPNPDVRWDPDLKLWTPVAPNRPDGKGE